MKFKAWLEGQTYSHDLKLVYHWDIESDWYKVLHKQGRNFPSKQSKKRAREYDPEALQRVYALWVSPNKNMNEFWARWMASSREHREGTVFYLHTIGMSRDLYQKYLDKERRNWNPRSPMEFVISQEDWDQLIPISVKKYSRKELLKLSSAASRRAELHNKWEPGILNRAPDEDNDAALNFQMGYNPNKKNRFSDPPLGLG